MKVSLIQVDAGDDKEANFRKAKQYIAQAALHQPDVICLPECFLYQGSDPAQDREELSSPYIRSFQELAKSFNTNIILGSIALAITGSNKTTNSTLVINRQGEIAHRYDKVYLYTVEREDVTYRESDSTLAGNKTSVFELDGVTMGIGICFDLRYPEYFRELTKQGAEVIFLPSNFRKITGAIAWEVLTRARAIENQVYFCAPDQTGRTGIKERCGNSKIISFDGSIISELDQEEGIVTADLDLERPRKFRQEFPVLKQMK